MASFWWVGLALLSGCNLASGLSDFDVGPPPSATGGGTAEGGSAGSAGAAGAQGGHAPEPCAPAPIDQFGAEGISAQWTIDSGMSQIVQSAGVLTMTVPPGVSDWWASVTSTQSYDLEGCGSVVELVAQLCDGCVGSFLLVDGGGNRVGFVRAGVQLRCQYLLQGGSNVNVQIVDYDAVQHRWLWVRPAGDATEWYGSPDGITWALLAKGESVVDTASLRVRLGAGVVASTTSPGFPVTFDNLNASP
jgi:hypothetical protein